MKRPISTCISLFTLIVLAVQLCIPASAITVTPQASDYIAQYYGNIVSIGNGTIKVSFTVQGTGTLEEIGASKITIEKKVGKTWSPVKTFDKTDYPELATTNSWSHAASIQYPGEPGAYYRAEIIVFGGPDSRTFTTNSQRA